MDKFPFLVPIISGLSAQVIKFILKMIRKDFKWKDLFGSFGDMPSSHSAFVVSLATLAALREGIDSTVFAMAIVYCFLVIKDATGFRMFMEDHMRILQYYRDRLPASEKKNLPELEKRLGHTWMEILAGGAIGFLITIFLI